MMTCFRNTPRPSYRGGGYLDLVRSSRGFKMTEVTFTYSQSHLPPSVRANLDGATWRRPTSGRENHFRVGKNSDRATGRSFFH